jgi:hypothetical protein
MSTSVKKTTERQVVPEVKQVTAEVIKAQIEAQLQSAYEQALNSPRTEGADPEGWWNLAAIGPIQVPSIPGPVTPHQVIKVGEDAFIATVMILNPFLVLAPGTTAADVLSNFALPYEVQYQTGNLTSWSIGPANLNVVHGGTNLVPGQFFYVDVLQFTANTPGIYEMNISARILGATPPFVNAPQFAGFARAIFDIDADLFFSGAPGMQFDQPIRFQVYP